MRLIVGLDVRYRSQGAIRFAAWLKQHLDAPLELSGVHVVEHDDAMVLLRRLHLDELLTRRRTFLRETIAAAGATAVLPHPEVVQGTTADEHLAHALQIERADGLVVGRSAARDGTTVVRLGRVARRLARGLPGTLVIVPPDLELEHLGDGPVLCAAAPTLDSLDAVRAAIDVARRLGRGVRLVHGVRVPDAGPNGGGSAFAREIADEVVGNARRRLEKWCEAYGVADPPRDVIAGDPEEVIRTRADELGSPLVVCGSRRLDLVRRAFTSSLATHLAGYCRVPVMIVPPR